MERLSSHLLVPQHWRRLGFGTGQVCRSWCVSGVDHEVSGQPDTCQSGGDFLYAQNYQRHCFALVGLKNQAGQGAFLKGNTPTISPMIEARPIASEPNNWKTEC